MCKHLSAAAAALPLLVKSHQCFLLATRCNIVSALLSYLKNVEGKCFLEICLCQELQGNMAIC